MLTNYKPPAFKYQDTNLHLPGIQKQKTSSRLGRVYFPDSNKGKITFNPPI